MPQTTFPEKVDLFTSSKDLEDLMLAKFPGVIKGSQLSKLKIGQERAYGFSEVDGPQLKGFLAFYNSFPYTVIDSKTREVIEEKKDG